MNRIPKIRFAPCLLLIIPSLYLFSTALTAQPGTDVEELLPEQDVIITDWQVEVIAFIHRTPDEAFRDRTDLDDYRDLPPLPALLTATNPVPEVPERVFDDLPVDPVFGTETMANAWQSIAEEYQRVGYFHWQQPPGRGIWRRLHDDRPLRADDSLSLGPHFEFDGRIRITTDTIGYANLLLVHRTPLLVNPGFSDQQENQPSWLWRTLKLEQQRRIQPARVEYFDSSGLGLLILITPPPDPEALEQETEETLTEQTG